VLVEYRKKYQQWLEFPGMDEELSREMTKIFLNENEIANRFSKEIAFGTASHNPPADKGYKVYGLDGGQTTDCQAHAITEQILQVENELTIPLC